MPVIRVDGPQISVDKKRELAKRLTEAAAEVYGMDKEHNSELHGSSLLVRNDPYRLYIYIPQGFNFAQLTAEPRKSQISTEVKTEGELLVVEMLSGENQQVDWVIRFAR